MLGNRTYAQTHIDSCRDRIDEQLATYRILGAVPDVFSAVFFNDLVVVLDAMFAHRLRSVEGRDSNALNEVRVLAQSWLQGDVLQADRTIKLKPEVTILGLNPGDPIALVEADFIKLAEGYFAEIESKFAE